MSRSSWKLEPVNFNLLKKCYKSNRKILFFFRILQILIKSKEKNKIKFFKYFFNLLFLLKKKKKSFGVSNKIYLKNEMNEKIREGFFNKNNKINLYNGRNFTYLGYDRVKFGLNVKFGMLNFTRKEPNRKMMNIKKKYKRKKGFIFVRNKLFDIDLKQIKEKVTNLCSNDRKLKKKEIKLIRIEERKEEKKQKRRMEMAKSGSKKKDKDNFYNNPMKSGKKKFKRRDIIGKKNIRKGIKY